MKYEDFVELGSEAEVKNQGKYMMKGKEYVVEDGDIIFFKFNKPNPSKKKWINNIICNLYTIIVFL